MLGANLVIPSQICDKLLCGQGKACGRTVRGTDTGNNNTPIFLNLGLYRAPFKLAQKIWKEKSAETSDLNLNLEQHSFVQTNQFKITISTGKRTTLNRIKQLLTYRYITTKTTKHAPCSLT